MDFLNTYVNTNKIIIGLAMICVNVGSKYIIQDLTDIHTKLMMNKVFKQFVLVCIFFMATRDILISIILTFLFSTIVYGLLDEKKQFNLLHSSLSPSNIIRSETYKNFYRSKGSV